MTVSNSWNDFQLAQKPRQDGTSFHWEDVAAPLRRCALMGKEISGKQVSNSDVSTKMRMFFSCFFHVIQGSGDMTSTDFHG